MANPNSAATDDELIAAAADGSDVAFASLVDRHADAAFRAAWLVLRDTDDARDAVQEAIISIHRSLYRFRRGEPFRPWLLRIVGNRARNHLRAAGRRGRATGRAAAEPMRAAASPSPEAMALHLERRQAVLAAIEELGRDDRVVIGARYFAELSEAETAALLGVARGTVKSRLSRARARLREQLTRAGVEVTDA